MKFIGIYVYAEPGPQIGLRFRHSGMDWDETVDIPAGWDAMDRSAKLDWCQTKAEEIAAELDVPLPSAVEVFPDIAAQDSAKDGFDGLPGWASWTPAEAEAWVNANVTDLPSARTTMGRMAAAIMFLRDIVMAR